MIAQNLKANIEIGGASAKSLSVSQIKTVFEYSIVMGTIKIIFIKVENIKTVLITLDDQAYASINLTHAYDFANELLKRASAKWERDTSGYYPNPFKTLRQNGQAYEELRQILNNLYFSSGSGE
jgi:hypothetical protein